MCSSLSKNPSIIKIPIISRMPIWKIFQNSVTNYQWAVNLSKFLDNLIQNSPAVKSVQPPRRLLWKICGGGCDGKLMVNNDHFALVKMVVPVLLYLKLMETWQIAVAQVDTVENYAKKVSIHTLTWISVCSQYMHLLWIYGDKWLIYS